MNKYNLGRTSFPVIHCENTQVLRKAINEDDDVDINCVIYLLHYHDFNLGDTINFSENVSNGGRHLEHMTILKIHKKSSNHST